MGIDVQMRVKGLDRVRRTLKETTAEAEARIAEDLYDWADHFLVERIALNTPIKTGALRRSLDVTQPVIRNHRVRLSVFSDLSYALRIHEETFNLGPISRAQPGQPEGGVGNKYITRVVRFHGRTLRLIVGGSITLVLRKRFPSGAMRRLR